VQGKVEDRGQRWKKPGPQHSGALSLLVKTLKVCLNLCLPHIVGGKNNNCMLSPADARVLQNKMGEGLCTDHGPSTGNKKRGEKRSETAGNT